MAGALQAAADGIVPVLYGPAALDTRGLEHVVAEQVIAMDEKPAEAVRAKPDSSLVAACRAIPEGRADAVVSAGNTGAMLAAGLLEIRRLPGVMRPAIAVPIPARDGPSVLLDCGANADARAEHLLQFAHMGAIFAEEILGLPNPEVRLLSIGEEAEKGNQLDAGGARAPGREHPQLQGATPRAATCSRRRRTWSSPTASPGNVALKTLEGTIRTVIQGLREEITAHGDRQARRPPDPPRVAASAQPARSRHLRRRLSARPARPRRDRARQLVARARSRTRSASPRAASSTTSCGRLEARLPQKAETAA